MSESPPSSLNQNTLEVSPDAGVAALVDMAKRQGLHAAKHEAAQAWQDVVVDAGQHKISATWQQLYPGHQVETTRVALLRPSQLPVWIVCDNSIGIVTEISDEGALENVMWFGRQPNSEQIVHALVLVPVSIVRQGDNGFIKPKARGVASEAILTGLRAHKKLFFRAGLATVFINLIAILSSLFAMQVYDRVVPNFAYSTLFFLAGGLAVAYVVDLLLKFARLGVLEASKHRLDEALSLYLFEKVMGLKIDLRPQRVGSLVAQIRDYESVKAFFSSTTLFAIADLPFVILFILVIYMIGGSVAIVPAVFTIICLVVGIVAYPPMAKRQRENNEAVVRKQGLLYEAIAGGEYIKAAGGEAKFGDAWLSSTRETCDKNESLTQVVSTAQFTTSFFQQLGFVSILAVGVYVIEQGEMTMGGLIACSILGGRALSTIAGISGVLLNWHHARYSLQVLNELMNCPSDDEPSRQSNTQSQRLDLLVKEVVYQYQGSTLPQLAVPALNIAAGDRVAVLGKNGSGKTTLLKLLAALYTPSAGQVTVAGLDVEQCRPSWLREVIGFLPQDPRLFSGTLLDNLALGMSLPTEEEIWKALELTGLDRAVRSHGEGLLLPIHEGGVGLSGGQRQLVGLTRMVLQQPKIWLLDEPSASLDSESEAKVVALIKSLPESVTVVFTTHRTNWLDLAKRVLIVEDGAISYDAPADQVKAVSAKRAAALNANNDSSKGGQDA